MTHPVDLTLGCNLGSFYHNIIIKPIQNLFNSNTAKCDRTILASHCVMNSV